MRGITGKHLKFKLIGADACSDFNSFGLDNKYTKMKEGDWIGVPWVRLTTLTGKLWPGATSWLFFGKCALKIEFQYATLSRHTLCPNAHTVHYSQLLSVVLYMSRDVTVLFSFVCFLIFPFTFLVFFKLPIFLKTFWISLNFRFAGFGSEGFSWTSNTHFIEPDSI